MQKRKDIQTYAKNMHKKACRWKCRT